MSKGGLMSKKEIIEKRSRNSKIYDNQNGTFTFEAGGSIAHHLKDNKWIETDCYFYGSNTEYDDEVTGEKYTHEVREYPNKIRINKFKHPLRIDKTVIKPKNANNITGIKYQNYIFYPQAWNGIDIKRIVIPEGLVEEIIITSEEGQRILEWQITGDFQNLQNPNWILENESGEVPFSFENNILSYDLTNVPIGATIA